MSSFNPFMQFSKWNTTRGMFFIAVIVLLVILFLLFIARFVYPCHWSTVCTGINYGYNHKNVNIAFYCKEPKILIINARGLQISKQETRTLCFNSTLTVPMQISGIGFHGDGFNINVNEKPPKYKGFFRCYHYLRGASKILFIDDEISKVFFIQKTLIGNCILHVDQQTFPVNYQDPLILVIKEDGTVRKIESFDNIFIISIASFLRDMRSLDFEGAFPCREPLNSDSNPETDVEN